VRTRLAFLIFVLAARRPRTHPGPIGWSAQAWRQYGRMGELS